MPKLFQDDGGISEIVGALILILIVVIAAAGLAMIVSQAEIQQANRQAHESAVSNEKLAITSILPHYNSTGILTSIDLNIQNLNVDDSNLAIVEVNNIPAANITSDNQTYDYKNRLVIPGSSNQTININMSNFVTPINIYQNSSIMVQLVTSFANYFNCTVNPPVANMKFDVKSDNLGTVSKDYILLDASDSTSDTGQIVNYTWMISDGSNLQVWNGTAWLPMPGYWEDPIQSHWTNYTISTSGKTYRFDPMHAGPFRISLKVKDNIGLIGNSNVLIIPADPNFVPPFSLIASYDQQNATIIASLNDSNNNGCKGNWINFQPTSANITVWPTGGSTDDNGNISTHVTFYGGTTNGNVLVSYGGLNYNINVKATQPIADYVTDSSSGNIPLTVHFTDNSSGVINVWQWDFGDGGKSASQNPSHTFTSTGTYTVKLTVSNSGGSNSTTKNILVNPQPPVPSFTSDKTSGLSLLDVQFTDTSTGNPTSWIWDFGDGTTSTNQNYLKTYNNIATQTYTVKLTVTNAGGSNTITKINYITINPQPPVPSFTSNKTSGQSPLIVQYNDTSTGPVTGWQWNFGDGSPIDTTQSPVHTYTNLGLYTVTLTVSNDGGSNTITKTNYIAVNPPPPQASFTSDKSDGQTPLTVQYTDTSVGSPTGWLWDFGDGSSSTGQNPIHTFPPNSGPDNASYIVKLTVSNAGGSTTYQKIIMVNPLPPVAHFTSDKTSGASPLTVQFTDSSSGSISNYLWDFGDGSTSTGQNPIHTFPPNPGPGNVVYTVILRVTNGGGSSIWNVNITINP
jgi:flagellin-like protein